MANLAPRPLEISDFSGGITDNYLQGDPRRSQTIDNFFITVDKKLEERGAFVPINDTAYKLASNGQRANGMFSFLNETVLMAVSGRTLSYLPDIAGFTNWTIITGKGSNEVIQGGDSNSQISYGEFQNQIYFTSDGGAQNGAVPSKAFRDTDNAWTAMTAGLPRSYTTPNYTSASLLTACINLANQLRTSFINHMQDAEKTVPPKSLSSHVTYARLHFNTDYYSLSYLQSGYTFNYPAVDNEPGPSPTPTPAPAATDQASLFTLVYALCNAYTHHVTDAMGGINNQATVYFPELLGWPPATANTYQPAYHINTSVYGAESGSSVQYPPRGPHVPLSNTALPTTLLGAAAQLDDMLTKWNWHRKAVWTHSIFNDPAIFDKYGPTLSKIGAIQLSSAVPTVTPDLTDLYGYVNKLKYLFNFHAASGGASAKAHKEIPNAYWSYDLNILLPDCTDSDSMGLLVFWLRSMYQLHFQDASIATHVAVTFAATAGSAAITTVTRVSTGAAYTMPSSANGAVESYLYIPAGSWQLFAGQTGKIARTTTSGSGTATMDRTWAGSTATFTGYVSKSIFHTSYSATTAAYLDAAVSPEQTTDALGQSVYTYGSTPATWLTLANDFYVAFQNHVMYANVHQATYVPATTNSTAYQYVTTYVGSPFFIPSVATYSYAFFFSNEYTVETGGLSYLIAGNPVLTASATAAMSLPTDYMIPTQYSTWYNSSKNLATRANVLSNLPVLVNTASTNYDLTNVKLNIYRTTNAGQTYRLVKQLSNGTTSYSDTINDTLSVGGQDLLATAQTIYTTGGNLGSDQPPQCKFMHILNGTAFYGAVTDSGQFFPNRIRQAVQLAPDWCPASLNDDLDDALTGLSSTRSNLIAFCKNSIYRMVGAFSQIGQGSLTHERISDTTGSLNSKGIVRTEIGLFFAGNDGFYYTDGYQIIKISIDLDKTYASLTSSDIQKRAIAGAYDKVARRIWWSMRVNPIDQENSIIYVYYLNYGVKPSGVFTTVSNYGYFYPSSLVFQQGRAYVGHGNGYTTWLDPLNTADRILGSHAVDTDTYLTTHIPYNWTSSAMSMGTTFMGKWITKIHLVGKNNGNVSATPYAVKDLNENATGPKAMSAINYNENIRWGTNQFLWGDPDVVIKLDGKMDLWRWFPQGSLHSDFMQIKLVPNTDGVVYSYAQDYARTSLANIFPDVVNEVILSLSDDEVNVYWPFDCIGMDISFEFDQYATSYAILGITLSGTALTISDPDGTLIEASDLKWKITGTKKSQRVTISAIDIHFAYLGDKNETPTGAFTNSGPGNRGGNPS